MNHNPQQVAGNIRAIRRRRNLSQAELARLLGMRPGPVNNIEQGRNLPSAKVLCKLAAVLDVPIDNLFADPDAAQTSWLVSDDADAACVREAGVSYGAETIAAKFGWI
jgi:transcriptional regulator with XRE-family HTH domain